MPESIPVLDFGGQTRIAYTQDPNLHALEVTDLEKRGNQTTRRFFDGSKPEYPRPMRCIQVPVLLSRLAEANSRKLRTRSERNIPVPPRSCDGSALVYLTHWPACP